MLGSPLSSIAGWTFELSIATTLPKALQGHFVSTSGTTATGPDRRPDVHPNSIVGTSLSPTPLQFPFAGWFSHYQQDLEDGNDHWIWGVPARIGQYPSVRAALTYGAPLIALRFQSDERASSRAFPASGVELGQGVVVDNSFGIQVSALEIIATYPRRTGLDTLAIMHDLRRILESETGTEDFRSFVDELPPLDRQPLRLLEPSGRPITNRTVSLVRPGLADLDIPLNTESGGDLLRASGLSRSDLPTGSTLRLSETDEALAVASADATYPDGVAPITSTASHIDLAVLNDWFAVQQASDLAQFTRGNRVTPLINGFEYFDDLFTRLSAATSADIDRPALFYLTGYSIDASAPLISRHLGLPQNTLAEIVESFASSGGEARFLALQMLQLEEGFVDTAENAARIVALLLAIAGASATFKQDDREKGNFFGHTQALAVAAFFGANSIGDLIDTLEINKSAVNTLAGIDNVEAFLDPYPLECPDNPLCASTNEFVELVHAAQKRFSVFHQKIAIVGAGENLTAYCGGIDLHPNRLDDREHGRYDPYHDVHARVDGLATGELAKTFAERWRRSGSPELSVDIDGTDPFADLPDDGSDIVQIARTYFRSSPADSDRSFRQFAPNGERTILDTTIAAIRQARRYIYIEDQYLTPPVEYAFELVRAAGQVSGPLIIVIPETPEQPFGLERRQSFINSLGEAWGDRLKVGFMRGPFSRVKTKRTSAVGRVWLSKDLGDSAGDSKLSVVPARRLPKLPFWITVGGEAMRAVGKVAGRAHLDEVDLTVERGKDTNLFAFQKGPKLVKHKENAPACCGAFPGIYVHSKLMLIDDVFASIGSANCNRRGFYSDGECNLFALREELSHGENWIRSLRARLWSELLNVPESFGDVAFADPLRGLDLFDRKFTVGGRFSPFDAQSYNTMASLEAEFTGEGSVFGGLGFIAKVAAGLGLAVGGAQADEIFDTFIDPSSELAT